jgi:hypothetical protein
MQRIDYTFARHEEKYLLNKQQFSRLYEFLQTMTAPDRFGNYRVNNIYYDTSSYDIIRRSMEKPLYKEKLRLRYYGNVQPDEVFLELKKKYDGIVYKRRITLGKPQIDALIASPADEADEFVSGCQITQEIRHYLLSIPPLTNQSAISYKRIALVGLHEPNLRITFDTEVLFNGVWSLCDDRIIMEIKADCAMPPQLSRVLSANRVFPSSFSKYKTAYMHYIYPFKQEIFRKSPKSSEPEFSGSEKQLCPI